MGYTMYMNKKNLTLLFGGKSSEYEVSVRSAQNIYDAINTDKYNVVLVNISKNGEWRIVDAVRDAVDGDEALQVDLGQGKFYSQTGIFDIDVVFPVLHGKFGEDGTVQGLLDTIGLPYVGCGTESSALCMDKLRTKRLLASAGIAVVPDVVVSPINAHDDMSRLIGDLPGPWFVKPCRAGSSVGVTKVKDTSLLEKAVNEALAHDDEILVETAVTRPRELEVAVMGNLPKVIVSGVGEIIPGDEFYSYDDKYSAKSTSNVIDTATLPQEVTDNIKRTAEDVYKVLNCRGLARVDFLMSDSGEIYVNEVNTMPGFTNISMFPKLMMKAGYSYQQLIDKLIELALQ